MDGADSAQLGALMVTQSAAEPAGVALEWCASRPIRAGEINQAVPLGALGKRRAVWTALGYALGKSEVSVLAFHDADIVTYDRSFLLRLLYPVVHLRY